MVEFAETNNSLNNSCITITHIGKYRVLTQNKLRFLHGKALSIRTNRAENRPLSRVDRGRVRALYKRAFKGAS